MLADSMRCVCRPVYRIHGQTVKQKQHSGPVNRKPECKRRCSGSAGFYLNKIDWFRYSSPCFGLHPWIHQFLLCKHKRPVANYIQNKVMFWFIEQEAACVKLSRRPSELRSWLIRPSLLSTKLLNRMY